MTVRGFLRQVMLVGNDGRSSPEDEIRRIVRAGLKEHPRSAILKKIDYISGDGRESVDREMQALARDFLESAKG